MNEWMLKVNGIGMGSKSAKEISSPYTDINPTVLGLCLVCSVVPEVAFCGEMLECSKDCGTFANSYGVKYFCGFESHSIKVEMLVG
jgi:hypothetical protein